MQWLSQHQRPKDGKTSGDTMSGAGAETRRTCRESGTLLDALEVSSCFVEETGFNQAPVEISDAAAATCWGFHIFPLSSILKM